MRLFLLLVVLLYCTNARSQCFFDPSTGLFLMLDGTPCFSLFSPETAFPFMGAGVDGFQRRRPEIRVVAPVLDRIVNTEQNPALLRQPTAYNAVQLSYAPWQARTLSNANRYALGISLRKQFERGGSWAFNWRDFNQPAILAEDAPLFSFDDNTKSQLYRLAYANTFGEHWNIGFTLKYAVTKQDENFPFGNDRPMRGFAADIGLRHQGVLYEQAGQRLYWQWGVSLSNLGPRVQTANVVAARLPIPSSLNLGALLEEELQVSERSTLRIGASYQVSKLLVPRACSQCDDNFNGLNDYLEYSTIGGMLASFADSPAGLRGEIREINHQFEMFATYRFRSRLAVRSQFLLFYQHPANGTIQYLTAEVGLEWRSIQLSGFYLLPNNTQLNLLPKGIGLRLGYQHFLTTNPTLDAR